MPGYSQILPTVTDIRAEDNGVSCTSLSGTSMGHTPNWRNTVVHQTVHEAKTRLTSPSIHICKDRMMRKMPVQITSLVVVVVGLFPIWSSETRPNP
ncbi:hypothetical protein TNCV_2084321 [Trichonephila clavipes]|uniref:Uncharacterized protein n=1 Tax=Trichonephila clavipes TaxID=2585209 RepID=A0A8X6V5L9_TRICX|nr:hypothetical protein TNCV_2084321 [Trichonephila clavipes]